MGKYNIVDIMQFIVRYLWIFCLILILIDLGGSIYTAKILTERNGRELLNAAQSELENRIDMTWKMVDSLSAVESITDTKVPLLERRELLKPYAEKFNLFMVAVTDNQGAVTSSARLSVGDVSKKEWFQSALSTGKGGVTNIFPAGLDNKTKQFTIYVPFFKDGQVAGTVFGSISLAEINQIILNRSIHKAYSFFIYDGTDVIQAHPDHSLVGKSMSEIREKQHFVSSVDAAELKARFLNKEKGDYWVYNNGSLEYVNYASIDKTEWRLQLRTDIILNSIPIIWLFFFKALVIIILCKMLGYFGVKVLQEKLRPIGTVIQEVNKLQGAMMQAQGEQNTDIASIIQVSQQGLTDQLTGLPTRTLFNQQINAWLTHTNDGKISGLFFIDMDGLKKINDTYGHAYGDVAIKYLADNLHNLSKEYRSIVTRYGGDEFLLYVLSVDTVADLEYIATVIMDRFQKPLDVDGKELFVQVSIGIAVYPEQADSIEHLIDLADKALYQAKGQGKNRFVFYAQ